MKVYLTTLAPPVAVPEAPTKPEQLPGTGEETDSPAKTIPQPGPSRVPVPGVNPNPSPHIIPPVCPIGP